MEMLSRALQIATEAHDGQVDKGGAPYILHPLRIMLSMATEEERTVAVLHDVLEDSSAWTLARLVSNGFSPAVVSAVCALTRRPDEGYREFISRVALNPLACRVKVADMRDNMDLSRIPEPTDADRARVAKYARYIDVLAA
jgi:(p)ppGpp synthase/HD superfamily hydrolase